eukprot:446184-Pleurochrysis_carterae.AAC.2
MLSSQQLEAAAACIVGSNREEVAAACVLSGEQGPTRRGDGGAAPLTTADNEGADVETANAAATAAVTAVASGVASGVLSAMAMAMACVRRIVPAASCLSSAALARAHSTCWSGRDSLRRARCSRRYSLSAHPRRHTCAPDAEFPPASAVRAKHAFELQPGLKRLLADVTVVLVAGSQRAAAIWRLHCVTSELAWVVAAALAETIQADAAEAADNGNAAAMGAAAELVAGLC